MQRILACTLAAAVAALTTTISPVIASSRVRSVAAPASAAPASAAPASAAPTATPKRIRFERGAICVRIPGSLAPGQDATYYVLQASQGQHLIVNLAPGSSGREFANVGVITAPSGAEEGGKGGRVFDAMLSESGDYKIRVARNLMATNGGRAAFVLEIVAF